MTDRDDLLTIFIPPPTIAAELKRYIDEFALNQAFNRPYVVPNPFIFSPAFIHRVGHRPKHTAARLFALMLAGSPFAQALCDMAAHHLSATNQRKTRVNYVGRTEMIASIAIRAKIPRALNDAMAMRLRQQLRCGELLFRRLTSCAL